MKLKIENKKTGKHKFFTRRDVFIEFLKQQNPNVPEHAINSYRVEALVDKYLTDWFIVRGY